MDCLAGERNICFLGYGRRQKNVFVGLLKFDFSLDRIKWHFAFISRDIQGMKTRKEKMRWWYLCCFISQVSWNNFASLSSIHHHELGSSKPQRVSLVGNLTSKNEKKTIICFGLLHLCLLIAYSVGGWRPILALINQFPLQKKSATEKVIFPVPLCLFTFLVLFGFW